MDLPDGHVLTWCVITEPDRVPFLAWFNLHGRPEHWSIGKEHLAAAGHPDAELPDMGTEQTDSARLHR